MLKLSDRTLILLLVALQLAICLPFITSFPVALDEPFSIFWAQQDLQDMVTLFASENNPPLHFVLLHVWIKWFGIGAFSVRSLSLLFSVLTIPVIFSFARKLVNQPLAALAALIFICSTFNHYHALEARVYSLFVLLSALAFITLYDILFENKKRYLLLALWNASLLYAHYLGGFLLGVEILLILIFYSRLSRQKMAFLLMSFALTAVLYLPGIKWFFQRLGNFSEKGTWVPEAQYSELYGNIIRFFNNTLSISLVAGVALVLLVVFFKDGFKIRKQKFFSGEYLFIFLLFLIPYSGMFLFSKLSQPIFLDRYLLFTTVPLYLAFVLILSVIIPEKRNLTAFLVIVPMIFSCKWKPSNNREPDAEAAYVKTIEKEHTAIALCPPFYDLTFMYHYNQAAFENYRQFSDNKRQLNVQPIYNYNDLILDDTVVNIIFIDANSKFLYPENTIRENLEQRFQPAGSRAFEGGVTIYEYR